MLLLARRAAAVERDRLHGIVIGSRQTTMQRTEEGQAVLIPDYEAIDSHLLTLFSAPAPGLRPLHKECPDASVAIP